MNGISVDHIVLGKLALIVVRGDEAGSAIGRRETMGLLAEGLSDVLNVPIPHLEQTHST